RLSPLQQILQPLLLRQRPLARHPEAGERERGEVEAALAVERLLGEGFAEGGGVLEAVAGAGGRDEDPLGVRVAVDDEARVRGDRVEAGLGAQAAVADSGDPAPD